MALVPPQRLSVRKFVSGGQTGADRAALDFARDRNFEHGGWVPAGRLAEDGPVAAWYGLVETPSAEYEQRTEWNVRDSDATLIVSTGPLTGGSALTLALARKHGKPVLHADCTDARLRDAAGTVRDWLNEHRPRVLNVAGPRESTTPGIYEVVRSLLERVFSED
jgi:hypothetical protein